MPLPFGGYESFHFGTSMPFREAGVHYIIRLGWQKALHSHLTRLANYANQVIG
jgi:hypothetical protein